MLNIQQVTEAINRYRRNKGFIRKITRTDHPAVLATEAYLKSLQLQKKDLLSNQDLFNINRFFLLEHPVKPGKASYMAWSSINYRNFCALKTGYQGFPSNTEKMQEFFQILSQCYQENTLTGDRFLALSKLCAEGMLSQAYINVIKQSAQANFLATCLITMKHTGTLTLENQEFILAYSGGSSIVPVTHSLVSLDKAGLNTLTNREILVSFPFLTPLYRTIKLLEKNKLLTSENFDLISAENNLSWLLALEEMPEDLITVEVWQRLVNLSKKSHENEFIGFKKDIKDYIEELKMKLNDEQIEKDRLTSKDHVKTQIATSRRRFFSVTPVNLAQSAVDKVPKVNFVP